MKHCGYDMLERKDPYNNFELFWWCASCGARKPKEDDQSIATKVKTHG